MKKTPYVTINCHYLENKQISSQKLSYAPSPPRLLFTTKAGKSSSSSLIGIKCAVTSTIYWIDFHQILNSTLPIHWFKTLNSNTDWLVQILFFIPQHKTLCSSIVLGPISLVLYGEHTYHRLNEFQTWDYKYKWQCKVKYLSLDYK